MVNDGSPDNSQKSLINMRKISNKIKAYIKENGGVSDARNYGIKRATGEYISFVDSDDFVDTTMFENFINKPKEWPCAVCDFS